MAAYKVGPYASSSQSASFLASLPIAAKRALVGVGLISAAINLLALTGSLFMLQVYDRVLPSSSLPTLVALSILTVALFAFYGLLDFLRRRVLVGFGTWLDASLGARAYDAVVQLPLTHIQGGEKLNPVRDLDAVRAFLSSPALGVLFDLPWTPLYIGLIYLFHPLLALLAFGGMIILVAVMIATEVRSRDATSAANAAAIERQRALEVSRRNAATLRALGMAKNYMAVWDGANERYLSSQQRVNDIGGGYGALARTLRMILQSAVLGVGAYLVIKQEASAGVMIAASIITGRALAPLDSAIPNWNSWLAARQSWARLSKLLKSLANSPETLPLRQPMSEVRVERVQVAPPGSNRAVLQDVSFKLERSQGLGIIGPSAAGKSSLAHILVGAWAPVMGKVRLDGAALDQWQPEELGKHIGYLPQSVELFPGTIAQNIARFEPNPDSDAIICAAEAAGVHELIVNLPEGYQTTIGQDAPGLSAGQMQRIALARALYRDPFLVVLDEPNSNLDADGEAALTRAILGVRQRGGIAIVVAHRPTALAGVDTLLVLGQGRVRAFGPKDEILTELARPPGQKPPLKVVPDPMEAVS
ncbi:MAG: type I secretion system permease/ATPase [Hyphomicrobium sp.]